MKASLVVLVLMLSSFVSAQTTTITKSLNAEVDSYFELPDQTVVSIAVSRVTDPDTQVVTTQLFYSTCPFFLQSNCLQGRGVIPNSAFTGVVHPNVTQVDRFTVKVDTSTVPGYQNLIYTNCDEFETCNLGPAPGGLVSVTWTKTLELANISTDTTKAWVQGKLTSASTNSTYLFTAKVSGKFLGMAVVNVPHEFFIHAATDKAKVVENFNAMKGAAK